MSDQTVLERRTDFIARAIPVILAAVQSGNAKILPRLMDTKVAARYLGMTEGALRHLKHRHAVPFVRIKSRVMYDRVQLDKWIERSAA